MAAAHDADIIRSLAHAAQQSVHSKPGKPYAPPQLSSSNVKAEGGQGATSRIQQTKQTLTLSVHDTVTSSDVLLNEAHWPDGASRPRALFQLQLASALDRANEEDDSTDALNGNQVHRAYYVHADLATREHLVKFPKTQISVPKHLADALNLGKNLQIILSIPDEARARASHLELVFKDQYVARADMWRLINSHLADRTVYRGQKIEFMNSIKVVVKTIFKNGNKVDTALFHKSTKPIFRSESARYVLFIQMSKEMWEFDSEGNGEVMFDKVVSGFLPELFKRWKQLQVRHLISIVLFTRMEYHRGAATEHKGSDWKEPQAADRSGYETKDYYRVVVSDSPSTDLASVLDRLKKEFKMFLRNVSLRQPDIGEYAPLGSGLEAVSVSAKDLPKFIVSGEPSSASQGNILEAINLASSQFSSDYIDRDLMRTGVSIIVVSPGTGVFEVDHDLLVSTTDNLTDNGVGIDLVCLSRVPLHSVPLFKYRQFVEHRNAGKETSETSNTPNRSYSNTMSLGTPNSAEGNYTPKNELRTGTLNFWKYGIPHWVDISFWTTLADSHTVMKTPKSSSYQKKAPQSKPFKPRVRMYELQMMGVSENAFRDMALPPLRPSSKGSLLTTGEKAVQQKFRLNQMGTGLDSGSLSPHDGMIRRYKQTPPASLRSDSPSRRDTASNVLKWMDRYDDTVFKQRSVQRRIRPNVERRRRKPDSEIDVRQTPEPSSTPQIDGKDSLIAPDLRDKVEDNTRSTSEKSKTESRSALTSSLRSHAKKDKERRKISFGPRGLAVATPTAAKAIATTDNVNRGGGAAKNSSSLSSTVQMSPQVQDHNTTFPKSSLTSPSGMSTNVDKSQWEDRLSQDSSEAEIARPIPIQRMTGLRSDERESSDSDHRTHQIPQYRIDELRDVSQDVPDDVTDGEIQLGPELPTISPTTSLAPWLTVLNPCNPAKTKTALGSRLGRWQHLFPKTLKASQIKWRSLCSPAAVPLTSEDFPTADQLAEEYRELSYTISLPEEMDLSPQPRSLANELLAFRLSRGFQLVVGKRIANSLGNVSFEEKDVFNERVLAAEGAQVYLSRGGTIHCLKRLATNRLEIKILSRHAVFKEELAEANNQLHYTPLIRSMLADKYDEQAIPINPQRGIFDWQYIDSFIAGHERPKEDQFIENLRPWRARFVLIPTESPANSRRTSRSKDLNEEENRLEGIRKLTQLWQKCRYVLPEDRRYTKNTRLKEDANPLDVQYFTKKLSVVVADELQTAMGDTSNVAPVQLLPEDDLFQRPGLNTKTLAEKLQSPDGIRIVDRRWHWKLHHFCFIGSELASWILENFKDVKSRNEACDLGNELMKDGLFRHVEQRHEFRDGHYFYQLTDEYRAPKAPSRGLFKWPKASVPPTPVKEASTTDSLPPASSHVEAERAANPEIHSPDRPEANQRQNPTVALGKSMIFNLLYNRPKQSYREELINLHYDRLHNPDDCYHIRIEWMNTTPKLIQDAINHWAMLMEPYGLRLVELPISEASSITSMHPFRSPFVIYLARKPLTNQATTPHDSKSSVTQEAKSSNHFYQEAILQRFNFVLDFEASSSFPENVNVMYSWGKPDYKYSQYIHRSGLLIAQITTEGRILILANRLYNNHSSSARIKTFTDEDSMERSPLRINALRANDGLTQRSAPSPKHSPSSSPALRPALSIPTRPITTHSPLSRYTPPNQIEHANINDTHSSTISETLDPERLTREIQAFCNDVSGLEAFYTELQAKPSLMTSMPTTPAQSTKLGAVRVGKKARPEDEGREEREEEGIPELELPGSLTEKEALFEKRS